MLLSTGQFQRVFLIDSCRIKDAQESSGDHLVDLHTQRGQAAHGAKSLAGRHDSVMVGDLLIVDIAGLCKALIGTLVQNFLGKAAHRLKIAQTADILCNFLCYRRGKHPGVGTRVCHQLFLVQLLDHL